MKTISPQGYKVCVIRLDALGDTLLSTPALALMTGAGCQVTVITHPVGTPVLSGLTQTLEVTRETSASHIGAAIAELGPDAVLVFSEKRRAISAAYRSRVPLRVGFDPGMSQPLKSLSVRLALTRRVPFANRLDCDPGMHEAERYQKQVAALFPELVGELPPLHLRVPRREHVQASDWLTAHKLERPLALQLTPKWSLHGFGPAELNRLLESMPTPVLAFYGPAEAEWIERHFGGCGTRLCCKSDLITYAAFLAACRALVTVDTGAAHVAAAVGTPLVDVFPELHHQHCVRRWRPWKVDHRIVLSQPHQTETVFKRILGALQELIA